DAPKVGGRGSGGAMDPVLFAMMKDLRKKLGASLKLPPYVIFQMILVHDLVDEVVDIDSSTGVDYRLDF
ncbi:hypothetical protein CLI75_12540, partial [Porphyromonas gingivalis]